MSASNGARLYLVPAQPENIKVNWLSGSENPLQGWYSARSSHKVPATTVIYERENNASTVITTLLYPCSGERANIDVRIESLAVSGSGSGLAFKVKTPQGNDYLMLSDDDLKEFGPYQVSSAITGIRTDDQGNILSQFEWVRQNNAK